MTLLKFGRKKAGGNLSDLQENEIIVYMQLQGKWLKRQNQEM